MKAREEQSVWQGEGCGVPLGSQVLVRLGWAGLDWAGLGRASPAPGWPPSRRGTSLCWGMPCPAAPTAITFLLALQVSVTAREDVPSFGPPLPSPPVFQKVRAEMGSMFQAIKKIYVYA